MKKHHITLVGGQMAPVFIGAETDTFDEIHIIHTNKNKSIAVNLQRFFARKKNNVKVSIIEIDAYNTSKIQKSLYTLFESIGDSTATVNITGGTKPMALILMSEAEKRNHKVIYVNSEENKILVNINKTWKTEAYPNLAISVVDWFELYYKDEFDIRDESDVKKTKALTNHIFTHSSQKDRLYPKLREFTQKYVNDKKQHQPYPEWQRNFNLPDLQIKALNNGSEVEVKFKDTVIEIKDREFWFEYFAFAWFEYWIYFQLLNSKEFDDVVTGLKVYTEVKDGRYFDYNQFDVVATKNGSIFFIDAKLGKIEMSSITKLNSVKKMYGSTYSKTFIVSWNLINQINKQRILDNNHGYVESKEKLVNELLSKLLSKNTAFL
jgi:PHD/YefM family antitoxin component YafN of YafNO toxin-antitoxin module